MLKPIFTEKSTLEAKNGRYTFWVSTDMTKLQIKALINATFGVHVRQVHTINLKKLIKRTMAGKIQTIAARKKAIVRLSKDEKIPLFEEEKKKKSKKSKSK